MGTLAGTGFPGSGHTDFQISRHTVPTNFWGTSGGHFWDQLAMLFGTCFEDMCWPSLDPLFESACLPTNAQWNDWGLGSETLRGESNRSPGSGQLADNQTPRSDMIGASHHKAVNMIWQSIRNHLAKALAAGTCPAARRTASVF